MSIKSGFLLESPLVYTDKGDYVVPIKVKLGERELVVWIAHTTEADQVIAKGIY